MMNTVNDRGLLVAAAHGSTSDAEHFLRLDEFALRVRVFHGNIELADTINPLRATEFSSGLIDPTLYLPKHSLKVALVPNGETSTCPLKGRASYLTYHFEGGEHERSESIAWFYKCPKPPARGLEGRIAFNTAIVTTVISAVDTPPII